MSTEILHRAADGLREDWPEHREMGMDRTEWQFHRAVADWLGEVARQKEVGGVVDTRMSNRALTVARAYLGEAS